MANSLARNSTERAPSFARGSLNTPCSNRLYHNANPSRSHTKIFSRSPRRERNTNQCPLSGSSPSTAFTRSAKRSNPQRMSVASTASQMRVPCAPSRARKLGSPITQPPPRPPAPALARCQIHVPPPSSARCAAESRPASRSAYLVLAPLSLISLRQISSRPPHAAVSSTRKKATRTNRAPGRTLPHSARCAPARKPASATSLAPSCFVLAVSLRQPSSPVGTVLHFLSPKQDWLLVSLTKKRNCSKWCFRTAPWTPQVFIPHTENHSI